MEIVRIGSGDGVSVACEVVGQGAPVLLVHGTSSARGRWAPVLAGLGAGRSLHLMDRRGRGLSGDATAHDLPREVADVAALANAVGAQAIVAHSYGAILALEAAPRVPGLRRLVLYEPPVPVATIPPDPQDAQNIARIAQRLAAGDREGALAVFLGDILGLPAAQIAAQRGLPGWDERLALAHTLPRELAAVRGYRFDPARFAGLDLPVLVLLGGDSPPRYAEAAALVAGGLPRARRLLLPGQQHNAITTAPALFAGEVAAFLDQG